MDPWKGSLMTANPLVGTWCLQSFEVRDEAGNVTFPMGSDPEGYISYSDDGRMSVQFGEANRPPITSSDWLIAPESEISAVARGFIAYCGTFELQNATVSHHIDFSLVPNWVGEVFVRTVAFSNDTITLSTPPTRLKGQTQIATLVWRRVRCST
jgi:Lipocalin-like domain